MGWSLDYGATDDPELLDQFFLVAGKALYLATAFEAKCRYVLRIAKLAKHFEDTGDASATMALAVALQDRMLCATITELKGFPELRPADIDLLLFAKDARNYIAHECAGFGPLSRISVEAVTERLNKLREHVLTLAAGDNVVSRWVYEIEEKEPAPRAIQDTYSQRVEGWVFGESDVANPSL